MTIGLQFGAIFSTIGAIAAASSALISLPSRFSFWLAGPVTLGPLSASYSHYSHIPRRERAGGATFLEILMWQVSRLDPHAAVPRISVRRAAEAISFYETVLGAK